MKCSCYANYPSGGRYHPSLKATYERKGANGRLVKIGYHCPKCKCHYDLDGKKL